MVLDLQLSGAVNNWVRFLLRRLARLVVVLIGVAIVAFALAKLSPVDPINAYLGPDIARAGPEQRELIAAKWGLDQPVTTQFGKWLTTLAQGDLGWSTTYNAPVADVILDRGLSSLALMSMAWLLSGVIGFALGLWAGACPGSLCDRVIRVYSYILAATPTFWIAILLLIVFSVGLGWTPVCCAAPIGVLPQDVTLLQRLHHLVLPLMTLSVLGIAQIALHTRTKMIDIMQSDYVAYARAQGGKTAEIILRHGVRNAALPAITVLFASLGELFGGSVLAETVFTYPGLGSATIEAGIRGDVPLLLAMTLITTLFVSTGNTIADVLYHVADPRIAADRLTGEVSLP